MAGLNRSRLGVLLLLSSGFSTLPRRNVSLRGCDAGATVLEGAMGAGFALLEIAVLEMSVFSVMKEFSCHRARQEFSLHQRRFVND